MPSRSSCRIESVLDAISDLWTLAIIHELSIGPRRTVELFGSFSGMSSKTLATRLKKLRRQGIIERRSYPEAPPRVEYSLTSKGRELLPVLRSIADVAARWRAVGEAKEDSPPCRACEIAFGETAREEQVKEEPAPSHATLRKRTDVTLL